jgi:hypothetical protein
VINCRFNHVITATIVKLAILCSIVTAPRFIEFRLIKLISDLLMHLISQRDRAGGIRLLLRALSVGSLVPILTNDNFIIFMVALNIIRLIIRISSMIKIRNSSDRIFDIPVIICRISQFF